MALSDEERKRIAKGPFGLEMSRLALRFGKAVFFGSPPRISESPQINNGTLTLVDLGKGPIGITCSHVLKAYRRKLAEDPATVFQIGHFQFDPLKYLISDDPDLDLATIDLGQGRLTEILTKEPPGNQCYKPAKGWPPGKVEAENVIASLGGFPGMMRMPLSWNEIEFHAYTHSGSKVASANDDHFTCHFEREYWVSPSSSESSRNFRDFGGMSGGPVFIDRHLYFEFVGIIYEYGPGFDLLYIRLARFINPDGNISHN